MITIGIMYKSILTGGGVSKPGGGGGMGWTGNNGIATEECK